LKLAIKNKHRSLLATEKAYWATITNVSRALI